jgi:hypothetical protein
VVYLRGNNVGAISGSAADIVVAIGQRLLQNATNHVTNTVNVGVVKTTRLLHLVFYLVRCSGNQPTVSSANLSLTLPLLAFYQQQDSLENGAALNILTAANLTGTISAAVLGNSTFLLRTTAAA